jgi:hypothetical protein
VPKEKLYEHGSATSAVRKMFVTEVQHITWAYKLAANTINLASTAEVPEIQVFRIEAKDFDVSESVMAVMDRAIPFPIIFEVANGMKADQRVRMVAAYKQLGTGSPKLSPYYSTNWQSTGTDRQPLPVAVTLPALLAALLEPLTPLIPRPGEIMSETVDRLQTVRNLEREIEALERKMRNEPQFNRKIELHRTLTQKQAQLQQQR